jgi:hypothetical protein
MKVPDSFLEMVDAWRRKQPDLPSRAEAIRRLVTFAIAGESPAKPPRRPAKAIKT